MFENAENKYILKLIIIIIVRKKKINNNYFYQWVLSYLILLEFEGMNIYKV